MAAKKPRSANPENPNRDNNEKGGAPDQHQDPQRRLGNFTGKGEPARQGGRTGIGGQTKQKFKTDMKQQ